MCYAVFSCIARQAGRTYGKAARNQSETRYQVTCTEPQATAMPGMDNDKADKLVNKKVTGAERRMGVGAEGKMDAWSHWQNCEVFTAISHHRSISTASKRWEKCAYD